MMYYNHYKLITVKSGSQSGFQHSVMFSGRYKTAHRVYVRRGVAVTRVFVGSTLPVTTNRPFLADQVRTRPSVDVHLSVWEESHLLLARQTVL